MAGTLIGLLSAACYRDGQRAAAGDAARAFVRATKQQDASRACSLLSPEAAAGLQGGGRSCTSGLADLELPSGDVDRVDVWGDRARVITTDDTLYLVRLADGWRIAAAGCRRRTDRPYRCEVEG